MKLSILIPALNSRPWQDVYCKLHSQASKYKDIEIITHLDNGELTSGQKRNDLTASALGEYIIFVDDDDLVSDDYVDEIYKGCLSGCDVVNFNLFLTNKSRRETWKFRLCKQNRKKGEMTVNHLCAWKRSIATKVMWCNDLGYADDHLWYEPLYYAYKSKLTEYTIDKILYYYIFNRNVTANQTSQRIQFSKNYYGNGLRCFFSGDEILIEVGNTVKYRQSVLVRNSKNEVNLLPLNILKQFHTVRIA